MTNYEAEIDAYKSTIDTLCDVIRDIRERLVVAFECGDLIDEVLEEYGIEIEYDTGGAP